MIGPMSEILLKYGHDRNTKLFIATGFLFQIPEVILRKEDNMKSGSVNEFNDEIPKHIVSKAEEKGCINSSYIYIEGVYHGKLPKASIGCRRPTRFSNCTRVESMKVTLGEGWVIFKSPSTARSLKDESTHTFQNLKAGKHTSILCQVGGIFESLSQNYEIYLAHHKNKDYPAAEKDCENRAFYSLKMYSASGRSIMEPDCIVIESHGEQHFIRYVVEVKWGCLEGYPGETDVQSIFNQKKLENFNGRIRDSKECKVNGPSFQNGVKVEAERKDPLRSSKADGNTKYIVVTDLKRLKRLNRTYIDCIKEQYIRKSHLFSICDVTEDIDQFDSLATYLTRNHISLLSSSMECRFT